MSHYLSRHWPVIVKAVLQTVAGLPLMKDWISSPPASGLLIVQAEELADANTTYLQHLYHWAMQAGCAALVINLKAGTICLISAIALHWIGS